MFYYPEVLERHRGCLGVVWLAATCYERVTLRELLSVDVPRACAAVGAFLIGRPGWEEPAPPPGAPPPRSSLYLAATLALGLARVLRRQSLRALQELGQVLLRLHRALPPPRIDASPARRPQLRGDALGLMQALELAPDPFFGVMGVPALPLPAQLPQWEVLLPEELPPPLEAPPSVSPEVITLREAEPGVPPVHLEEELPEVTERELELLREAEIAFPVEEIPEVPAPPPPLEERPPEVPSIPPPPPKAPPRRRRRPAPPHIDPQPQIASDEFRAQLLDPRAHCAALVLLEPPHKRRRPPRELLRAPTLGPLVPELADLWGRCARPPSPPAAPPAPPELPSELEMLRETLEPSLPLLPSEISLEAPVEELPPPEERRPSPVLPELPEEAEVPPSPTARMEALRRLLLEGAGQPGGAELKALVPPGASRRDVGQLFYLALELCGARRLRLEQSRPFGPILVGLGPRPDVGQGGDQ